MYVNNISTDCGSAPAAPTNGLVTGTDFLQGDSVTYSCNTGFAMTGSATATCQADGTWDNTAITCNAGSFFKIQLLYIFKNNSTTYFVRENE